MVEAPQAAPAQPSRMKRPRRRFLFVPILVIFLLAVMVAGGIFGWRQVSAVTAPFFPRGMTVRVFPWDSETLDISGLTPDEALSAIMIRTDEFLSTPCVAIDLHGVSVDAEPGMIGVAPHIEECVEAAWSVYTSGTLEERVRRLWSMRSAPLEVPLGWECRSDTLSAFAQSLQNAYTEDMGDAFLVGWEDGRPLFSDFTPAKHVDTQGLTEEFLRYVRNESFGQPLVYSGLTPVPMEEQIAMLEAKILVLSRAEVSSTSQIMSATKDVVMQLDGRLMNPGDTLTLSGFFTDLPGEKYAADGSLLSSRLGTAVFQAAVNSGLAAMRWPGVIASPPSFTDPGLEAMAWDKSEVTITNNSDHSIVLLCGDDGETAWAEVRGEPILAGGTSRVLKSVVESTEPAPTAVKTVRDSTLRVGEEVPVSPATEGVTVSVYLVTTENGRETQEKKDELRYPPQPETIRVGTRR